MAKKEETTTSENASLFTSIWRESSGATLKQPNLTPPLVLVLRLGPIRVTQLQVWPEVAVLVPLVTSPHGVSWASRGGRGEPLKKKLDYATPSYPNFLVQNLFLSISGSFCQRDCSYHVWRWVTLMHHRQNSEFCRWCIKLTHLQT